MKIRILVENAYVGGGTARTVSSTASALARRGHDVEVVSILRRRSRPAFPMDERVRLYPLVDLWAYNRASPPGDARARAWRAARTLATRRGSLLGHRADYRTRRWTLVTDAALLRFLRSVDDGVLVGTRPAVNLAIAQFARGRVVRVAQDHMNLGTYRPPLVRSIRRWYPRLDAVVTLTEGDAKQYSALLQGRTRVLSIPNGVPDLSAHRAALDRKVVVAAGRLSRQKGYDRLLDAWPKVAAARPDWRLEIYGGGRLQASLAKRITKRGIGGSAALMGRSPEIFDRMSEASIYVMTSRREGLPMVLLEAMGVGLPVVSFDCPTGPRDVISDGVDGYVVPDGDQDALVARLLELIDDPDKRRRMGAAGVQKAASHHVDLLAERWERLFAELAAAKAR